MDEESPLIVAELISEDRYYLRDRGFVYTVSNPRDTNNGDWSWLVNHYVRLDGCIKKVLGVESYCILGLYCKGRPIGLLIEGELPTTISA